MVLHVDRASATGEAGQIGPGRSRVPSLCSLGANRLVALAAFGVAVATFEVAQKNGGTYHFTRQCSGGFGS